MARPGGDARRNRTGNLQEEARRKKRARERMAEEMRAEEQAARRRARLGFFAFGSITILVAIGFVYSIKANSPGSAISISAILDKIENSLEIQKDAIARQMVDRQKNMLITGKLSPAEVERLKKA